MTYEQRKINEIKTSIEEAIYELEKRDFDIITHTEIKTLKEVLILFD